MMLNQNKPNQANPSQTKPSRTKPNQAKPNQAKFPLTCHKLRGGLTRVRFGKKKRSPFPGLEIIISPGKKTMLG